MSGEFEPVALTPPPGVVKTEADRVVEGRWSDTQWVRFHNGKPQKRGGWTKQTTSLSSGVIRALHAWRDLQATAYIAAGTARKLYVYEPDFTQHDITPLAQSGTLTNPFSTVNGSNIVTVTDASHGRNVGDVVIYDGASAVGGITIDGPYEVSLVTGAGAYQITHSLPATSTAGPGGGSVDYEYEVPIGTERGAYGLGYGVGRYGIGTYGSARPFSTVLIEPRVWTLDHFGQVLVAAYNGGSVYDWDPSTPGFGRAEKIADAPTDVRAIFVTEERIVMALCDDMTVKWCSQGDRSTWTPAEDNTANIRRLSIGTKLIGGRALANHISLVWSNAGLYVFQYTGQKSVFSSRLAGRNCGLVSPSAAVTANGIAFWMGHTNFFYYNGAVAPIPNVDDIKSYVFKNLRSEYGYLCWGQYIAEFDEVMWFYVALNQDEPSYYVAVNLKDFSWDAGQLQRSAASNFDDGDTRPFIAAPDGHIYLHEDGYNADGAALAASASLAPTSMQKGALLLNVDGFEADFHDQSGDLEVAFEAWDRLRKPTIDTQTKTVTEDDDLVDLRISGRYVGLRISSNVVDGYFRFGKPHVHVSANGSRR